MSIICTNCKNQLSCGCQKRAASDGRAVCTTCIAPYEAKIKNLKFVPPPIPPANGVTVPTNVTVLYKGPGKQY